MKGIVLVHAHGETETGLERRVGRGDVAAPDPVALLEAERLDRLVAAGDEAVAAARRRRACPKAEGELGGAVELPAELADEGHPERQAGDRPDRELAGAQVGEARD